MEGDAHEAAQENEFWYQPELRARFFPSWMIALCGAILVIGLGWSLFGKFNSAEAASIDSEFSEDQTQSNISDAAPDQTLEEATAGIEETAMLAEAASLENQADALAAEGERLEEQADTVASAPALGPATALFSCRVQGMQIEAWRCIAAPDSDYFGGSLKISSNGSVRRYGPNEVMRILTGSPTRLSLGSDYRIEVQTNGDRDYTLRLEITRDGNRIFQDEVSSGSTLSAYSDIN